MKRLLFLLLLLFPLMVPAQSGNPRKTDPAAQTPELPSDSGPTELPLPQENSLPSLELLGEGGPFRPIPQEEPLKPKTPPAQPGKVSVEFAGGTAFKLEDMQGAIADTVGDIERQGLSNALADDAAFYLANYYREHGYSEVEVDWDIRGPHRLRLRIKEGRQQRLGTVRVRGNREVSRATLLDYLLGPTRERFPREQGNPPFVEADLESGIGWAQAYYLSQGYLNAEVAPPRFLPGRGGLVDVEVEVKEGTRYVFGEITFSGEPLFPREELLKALEKARTKREQKPRAERAPRQRIFPYTTQEVGRLQNLLEYHYKTKGYFNARVESTSNPASAYRGRVAVDFYIEPGEKYRFDGITVSGRSRLSAGFLPARFGNLQGETYNPDKVQEKVQEMTRTGLFKSFRVRQEAQEDQTVRLDINLEEAKAKELGFLLGFSTLEGAIIGASYRDRNLYGQGRPLTANAQYSTRGVRGEILYTDPWFQSENLSLRLRLYALTRQWDGYSKQEEGLRAELARRIRIPGPRGPHELEIALFLQGKQVNLTEILIQPDVDEELARYSGWQRAWRREQARQELIGPTSYLVNSLGLSTNFDTRDSKINPTRGWFVNTTLDSASGVLGSRVEFIRATFAGSYYHPVGKKGLLAFGARAGILNPFEERASIPIDERFFNGGSLSVRSFTERHLGPKDKNGYPVGGDSFTVLNAEYNHPIRGELAGATFVDAGSLSRGNGFGQMRYGVGVGLRYRLPIGPLRLDYAVNPTRKENESVGAFHFSFGFAF